MFSLCRYVIKMKGGDEMLKQRLLGLLLLAFGIAVPLIIGDATISVIFIPLGIYGLLSKNNVMGDY